MSKLKRTWTWGDRIKKDPSKIKKDPKRDGWYRFIQIQWEECQVAFSGASRWEQIARNQRRGGSEDITRMAGKPIDGATLFIIKIRK